MEDIVQIARELNIGFESGELLVLARALNSVFPKVNKLRKQLKRADDGTLSSVERYERALLVLKKRIETREMPFGLKEKFLEWEQLFESMVYTSKP